ncbi:MAG: type II toxin-antitoxin system HicB family antitoxin [bacterium]|nr:type II toxin-antitoxin system HicB family antitoxin [bacterium]
MKPSIEALDHYPIEIAKVSEEDGGGYKAYYPHLGRIAFCGMGKTKADALQDLSEVAAIMIEGHINKNVDLPDPPRQKQTAFSGKFVVRLPKSLHARLDHEADLEGMSLNSYVLSVLSDTGRSNHILREFQRFCDMRNPITQIRADNIVNISHLTLVMPEPREFQNLVSYPTPSKSRPIVTTTYLPHAFKALINTEC